MNDLPEQPNETSKEVSENQNWFNRAARSSILNALWLGPANIYLWLNNGRFEQPYYAQLARVEGIELNEMIAGVLMVEMVLLVLSLFAVSAAFNAAKANKSVFTSIMFIVCATLLWSTLSTASGL